MSGVSLRGTTAYLVGILALILVMLLVQQNRSLQEELSEARIDLRFPHVGMYVPTFQVETLRGDTVTVGETGAGGRQVVYVFSASCQFCRASLPALREIAAQVAGDSSIQVLGITLSTVDSTLAYVEEHQLTFPVLRFPSQKLGRLYRARSVPVTMVLNEEGQILYAKIGVLDQPATVDSVLTAARWQAASQGTS